MPPSFKITIGSVLLLFSLAHSSFSQSSSFADHWEYIGLAVEEPGYVIWGSSPVQDENGLTHLFVARWSGHTVEPGWRSDSEIAHYVSKHPEGPFEFSDISLSGTGDNSWDSFGIHNPSIHKVNDNYVLLYIGNDNPSRSVHPSNQKIGMAIAKSPFGPWEKVIGDGLILDVPKDPKFWNYKASNGVNNPALLQHPDGRFFLYFKSHGGKMGLAIANKIEGPYIQEPQPVTKNEQTIEDGYAFLYNGKIALLTTDNHGIIEEGGGLLWISEDGIQFEAYEKGFHRINDYVDVEMSKVKVHYGSKDRAYAKFERPQMLLIHQKPAYLYLPSGTNIYGGKSTVSYILRYKGE